jgi:small subunit ribosomal protein S4
MRALGVNLPGLSRKSMERRAYPPGDHGQNRRRKISDFGKQLIEKQKLRYNYGLNERQLRKLFKEAKASDVATGDKLAELLERRLDNVVFRAGLASTIPAARQLVNHGHMRVNGRKVSVPSYRVRVGDVVEPVEKSRNLKVIDHSLDNFGLQRPDWLSVNEKAKQAKVTTLPTTESIPFPIEMHMVVEAYNKLI